MAANGASGKYDIPFKLDDPSLLKHQSYVNGEWIESQSGKRFDIIDPGTNKPWATAPINSVADVDHAVKTSFAAFEKYKKVNPRVRAQTMMKWHNLIADAKKDIAKLICYETGKPMYEAIGEMDYALGFTWWFAGEAERVFGTVSTPSVPNRRVFTVKQPIGVCVALVPWNFPVAMVLRKAGAALAAGCTMVIKPSPETPLSVLALCELASRAGFAPGVLNVLTTDLDQTPALSEALCKHELVRKVTFTGSTRVGKLVARHCSEGLKKVTLELGGNCPFLVFDDADCKQAVAALMGLKWRHAGQACITANRVYVQKGIFQEFEKMLVEETKKLKVGHGAEEGTLMGPVTVPQAIPKVERQIEDAKKYGGKVVTGGKKPEGLTGFFYEPTVISGMKPEMLISREETFGPICALYAFDTEEEAVEAANKTSMGLASYFFTKSVDRTWRLLENLEAGQVGMNTGGMSAAETPFGGIKESGYGKESGKDVAIAEYLIVKSGVMTIDGQY